MASVRVRDALAVVALVLLMLAVFLLLRHLRGKADTPSTPVPTVTGREPSPEKESPDAAGETTPRPEPGRGVGEPPGRTPSGPGAAGAPGVAPPSTGDAGAAWTKREPVEFTEADLADCGLGVTVDLGTYEAAVGQEFDVTVGLLAPALESCALVLKYDPRLVAVVPGTASPVGSQFRVGIECYADEAAGRLALIHAGMPGMKNVEAHKREDASATWRMRALKSGTTRLEVMAGSSFTNARGEIETFHTAGGEITIR
ncbi:MAG: hypothetical protein JXR77_04825 [Lentisphaeria bacterium]|nr:hypothetical protein [Lentisphaeria bacterium]